MASLCLELRLEDQALGDNRKEKVRQPRQAQPNTLRQRNDVTNTEKSEKRGNERDKEREKHRESQAVEQPRDVVRQTRR